MKKMYVGLFLGLATAFMGINGVEAAKVSVIGSDNATVGDKITLNVRVSELDGETITSVGGQISYNKDYLELVSMKGMNEPYSVSYNLSNAKFAGFAMEHALNTDKNVLSVTFKLKKDGNTTVGFNEVKLSDANAVAIKDITVVEKSITISEKVEVVEPKKEEIVKEETPAIKEEAPKKEEVRNDTVTTPKKEDTVVKEPEKVVEPEVKVEEKIEEVVLKSDIKREDTKNNSTVTNNEVVKKEEVKTETKEIKNEEVVVEVPVINMTDFFERFKTLFTINKKENNNLFGFIGGRLMALLKRA